MDNKVTLTEKEKQIRNFLSEQGLEVTPEDMREKMDDAVLHGEFGRCMGCGRRRELICGMCLRCIRKKGKSDE